MEECRHGMNPEWCAECKGLKTPEEEQQLLDDQMIKLAERFNGPSTKSNNIGS